jgi:hypothetical protein
MLSLGARAARAQSTPTPASAVPVTPAGVPMVGPMLGPPRVTWLFTQGDANGGRGDALGAGSLLFEPIRLQMLGSAGPSGGGDPACRDNTVESTGTATAGVPGFAMQHAAALQLVPKLTLFGFSRGGCPNTAAGGAVVFAQPIRKDVSFVAGAGILHLPHPGLGAPAVTSGQAHMDLVLARPQGRSYSVGVGVRSGVTSLLFGGTL